MSLEETMDRLEQEWERRQHASLRPSSLLVFHNAPSLEYMNPRQQDVDRYYAADTKEPKLAMYHIHFVAPGGHNEST